MSNEEIGSIALTLSVLLAMTHALGFVAQKLRQPKLVGEILAGVLLGPFVLGNISSGTFHLLFGSASPDGNKMEVVLSFVYWLGLLLLMLISGTEVRKLVAKENRVATAWLLGVGTSLPFLVVLLLGFASVLPLSVIMGTANEPTSALLVLAIAVCVTSIPVLSRIFHDLGILHTRFASLILGSAVLEDIFLWGVLSVASGLAVSSMVAQNMLVKDIVGHVGATLVYMAVGLTLAPRLFRYLHGRRWNVVFRASPIAYILLLCFLYTALAAAFGINPVFAAFLAGFGIVGGLSGMERARFEEPLDAIAKVVLAFFTPIYFALVGRKLMLGEDFSMSMFLVFFGGSSVLAIFSVGLGAWLAGFRKLDVINLAVTANARGGPGIVLASVAYEAGIINAPFYTTLVLTAIFTSQAAGFWLRRVLSQKRPLLSTNAEERPRVK